MEKKKVDDGVMRIFYFTYADGKLYYPSLWPRALVFPIYFTHSSCCFVFALDLFIQCYNVIKDHNCVSAPKILNTLINAQKSSAYHINMTQNNTKLKVLLEFSYTIIQVIRMKKMITKAAQNGEMSQREILMLVS